MLEQIIQFGTPEDSIPIRDLIRAYKLEGKITENDFTFLKD